MVQFPQEIIRHQSGDFSDSHSGTCSQDLQPKDNKKATHCEESKESLIQDIER
jgi:hypothetical protein